MKKGLFSTILRGVILRRPARLGRSGAGYCRGRGAAGAGVLRPAARGILRGVLPLMLAVCTVVFAAAPALAACTGGAVGDMRYNADKHGMEYCNGTAWMAMGKTRTGADTINYVATSGSITSPKGIWGDGTYIYITNESISGAIYVYTFDGTTFTLKSSDSTHTTSGADVWGSGGYIYVADYTGGIDVYSVNAGTGALTYKTTNTTNTTNAYGVWGDGSYIYVADGGGGIDVYSFNGTTLTFKATNTTDTGFAYGIWGDGTYIYVGDNSNNSIDVYSFDGTTLTYKSTNTTYGVADLWGDGTYIYGVGGSRINAYSVNQTTGVLTYITGVITTVVCPTQVTGDGRYLYVSSCNTSVGGPSVYRFDGTTMSYVASDQTNSTGADGIWSDGTYVYISDSPQNVDAYNIFSQCTNPRDVSGTLRYNADWRMYQYCDGANWLAMGKGMRTFSPAVTFDAGTDYLLRGGDLTGNADSTMVTGSFWISQQWMGVETPIYCAIDSSTPNPDTCRFQISTTSGSKLHLIGVGTGGGTLRLEATTATTVAGVGWTHVLFSFDLADVNKRYIYINGVLDSTTWSTYSVGNVIDFTRSEHSVGAFTDGLGYHFNGDIDDFWLDIGTYMDLSLAGNRAKFRDSSGDPVDLGAVGANPTGSSPEVYLSSRGGGLAGFATNKGTGGGFTVGGALTASTANLPNLSCNHQFPSFKATNTTNSINARDVWGDGTFLYVADNSGGIDVYTFNGTTLTFKATNTTNSTYVQGVWGDGTFLYVGDATGGIDVYTVDPSTGALTFKATNTTNSTYAIEVWGDGTFLYVGDATGGIDVYTVDPSTGALTFKATNTTNTTNAYDVWGDGTYIYVADWTGGIDVYTVNPSTGALTFKATNTTNSTGAYGVWGDGTYIYVADYTNGIDVYTVNPSTGALTFKATNTTNSINAFDVWGDGTYIYVADGVIGDIDVYTVDPSTGALTFKATNTTNSTGAVGVWGDGTYIYVADNSGIDVYKATVDTCSCSSPTGGEGSTLYNSAYSVMQYCNGQNWMKMGW